MIEVKSLSVIRPGNLVHKYQNKKVTDGARVTIKIEDASPPTYAVVHPTEGKYIFINLHNAEFIEYEIETEPTVSLGLGSPSGAPLATQPDALSLRVARDPEAFTPSTYN